MSLMNEATTETGKIIVALFFWYNDIMTPQNSVKFS